MKSAKRIQIMKPIKYFVLICMGCLMIASASAITLCGDPSAPAFCNKIETGSTMTLTIGNLNTFMGGKFISSSGNSGVDIFNKIDVSSYSADLPSMGTVSAYLKGSIKEGGRDISITTPLSTDPTIKTESPNDLFEILEFFDSTSISGNIFNFNKQMSYTSIFG
jgi:hypothetical protein